MTDVLFRSDSKVELVQVAASDSMVARAAWVSNIGGDARLKETGRIEGLINFLWRERHTSPFEHGLFTFYIETPIFVAREFMRHRTQSFNEWSGRYAELEPVFYLPHPERPLVQSGKIGAYTFVPGTNDQYRIMANAKKDSYRTAWANYEAQLAAGIAREVARDDLPVGIYTKFFASVDPLNLMRFLTLRNDAQALYEIRDVAAKMEDHLALHMPLTYKAYRAS